jgi:hypothetical protein
MSRKSKKQEGKVMVQKKDTPIICSVETIDMGKKQK